MNKKKILFISRKFPPSIGGMEEANFQLAVNLQKITPTKIVSYGGSQKWLLLIYPYLFIKSFFKILSFRPNVILLGDGVMAPLGWLLKKIFKIKVVSIIHGLDITFNNYFYQLFFPPFIKRMDLLIAVSDFTKKECIKKGCNEDMIKVISNGIDINKYKTNKNRSEMLRYLEKKYDIELKDKKILLTIGRLVKRKGHAVFIKNVAIKLNEKFIYLIGGDGPEKENINKIISKKNLNKKVYLLGLIDEIDKKYLLNVADVFIMPNILIKDDVEGFGIVALEAASVGLPVLANKMQGIDNSVIDNETGYLISFKDSNVFKYSFNNILKNRLKMSRNSKAFCSRITWKKIAINYLNTL